MQIVLPRPQRTLLSPTEIAGLAAWYDISGEASTTSSNIRIDGSNRVSLVADKSGNSAVNCFCSNVVAGQSMSAANKSVTGNQVLTLDIAKESYRPAADRTIVNKLSGNDGFQILILTTGVVRLRVGNGSSVTNVDSTAALANTNFARTTVVITWTDGVGASFTQNGAALGAPVSAAVTLTNAATSIVIGLMLGRIYRVQVGSVYDCNPALASKLASSFISGGDTWTVTSSGDLGARISGERDLVQLTAAKQPIYLPWSGTNYGWLPGTSGSYFSTPDSAAVSPSTQIDLIARVTFAAMPPSGISALINRDDGGASNNSYRLYVTTDGYLNLDLSQTGGVHTTSNSGVIIPFTQGWVRGTWRASDGRVQFFTAADQESVPTSWTQLGTNKTIALASIFDSSLACWLGARAAGVNWNLSGRIWYASIASTIDGAPGAIFNPALYTSGTTFTASTGEVWTLNGGATIVNRTSLYFDGSDDYMKAAAFSLSQPTSGYLVGHQVGWSSGRVYQDGGTINTININTRTASPNICMFAGSFAADNTGFAVSTRAIVSSVWNGASSSLRVNRGTATTGNPGTAAANGFTLGASGNGLNWGNLSFNEAIIRSAADATATQDRFALYAGGKWGFST